MFHLHPTRPQATDDQQTRISAGLRAPKQESQITFRDEPSAIVQPRLQSPVAAEESPGHDA